MSGCVQYEQNSEMMVIAKIHVWKVPVLLYGDFADRVLIYIHGQGGRKEEAESFAEIATNYGWQVISADFPEHGEKKDKARFVPWEVIPELQKSNLATAYFELLANSFGLGTVIMSYPSDVICQLAPNARRMLEIPEDHYMRLIVGFGYPEIPYVRDVQKDRSGKIHRYTQR